MRFLDCIAESLCSCETRDNIVFQGLDIIIQCGEFIFSIFDEYCSILKECSSMFKKCFLVFKEYLSK